MNFANYRGGKWVILVWDKKKESEFINYEDVIWYFR